MKNAIILVIVILSCLAPALAGSPVVDVSLKVFKNGDAELLKVSVIHGVESSDMGDGEYRLVAEDITGKALWDKHYTIRFMADALVPRGVAYTIINEKIPYLENSYKLSFYKGEEMLFFKILDFCDYNERCDRHESFVSCPGDCKRKAKDGMCINDRDGFCDKDCIEGYDPDCRRQELFAKWSFTAFLALLIATVVAAAVERRKLKGIVVYLLVLTKRLRKAVMETFEKFK
ncbi:MAG: hypothetical protein ABIB71_07195 [Candidatus Woesearchaeota archaeon]